MIFISNLSKTERCMQNYRMDNTLYFIVHEVGQSTTTSTDCMNAYTDEIDLSINSLNGFKLQT